MSTSQITELAMMKPVMDEAVGPSGAEGDNSDDPTDARATQNLNAREWELLGGRGGLGDSPAALLGLTWETIVSRDWSDPVGAPIDFHEATFDALLVSPDGCEAGNDNARHEVREADERNPSVFHHSPALSLLAMVSAAFTN